MSRQHRAGYLVACATPFVAATLAAFRALHVQPLATIVGVAVAATVAAAAWGLAGDALRQGPEHRRQLAVTGLLLQLPFVLMALLWVGLGTPVDATPEENRMRYAVLLAMAVGVTSGIVVARAAFEGGGERLVSPIALAMGILAGTGYVVWLAFQLGAWAVRVQDGEVPPALVAVDRVLDVLLFVDCTLTYLATAALAIAMRRCGWLGHGAARGYLVACAVALALVLLRGLSFPDPRALSAPWYFEPGFVAGIPAIPWIMPALLGAVFLRRAAAEPG